MHSFIVLLLFATSGCVLAEFGLDLNPFFYQINQYVHDRINAARNAAQYAAQNAAHNAVYNAQSSGDHNYFNQMVMHNQHNGKVNSYSYKNDNGRVTINDNGKIYTYNE